MGAELQVTVKLHENVKYIGWYRCSTDDCEHERDKFRIAHVEKVTETIADNPNFNVYTNRTLVIKKVLPADGEKMFICIFEEKHTGRKRSTTILHVVKDDNRGGGGGASITGEPWEKMKRDMDEKQQKPTWDVKGPFIEGPGSFTYP